MSTQRDVDRAIELGREIRYLEATSERTALLIADAAADGTTCTPNFGSLVDRYRDLRADLLCARKEHARLLLSL